MSNKPDKLLTLVFLRREGEVLLAMKKRGFGAGRWNGVGGKVEAGESIEQALLRETDEEIGVTLLSYEEVADIQFDEVFDGKPTCMHVHVYMADQWTGEPAESEEMCPEWFKLDMIPYYDMWPDDAFWLPAVLAGKKLQAEFVLDEDDRITSHNVKIVEKV